MKLKYYINEEAQKEIKSRMVDEKGSKCILCGYDKFKGALQFHHIEEKKDLATKIFGSKKQITQDPNEAKRTILLCANCHAEVTGGLHPEIFKKIKKQKNLDFDEELDTEVFYNTTDHLPIKKFVYGIEKYIDEEKNLVLIRTNKIFLRQLVFALSKRLASIKKEKYTLHNESYDIIEKILKKLGHNYYSGDIEEKQLEKIKLKKEAPIKNERMPRNIGEESKKNIFYSLIEKTFESALPKKVFEGLEKEAERKKIKIAEEIVYTLFDNYFLLVYKGATSKDYEKMEKMIPKIKYYVKNFNWFDNFLDKKFKT